MFILIISETKDSTARLISKIKYLLKGDVTKDTKLDLVIDDNRYLGKPFLFKICGLMWKRKRPNFILIEDAPMNDPRFDKWFNKIVRPSGGPIIHFHLPS